MLSYFNRLVKDHFITLIILAVALISFGAGWLLSPEAYIEPIIIQNPPCILEAPPETIIQKGSFVGSINSNKYHWPDCPWAEKISSENQVWFDSEEEAQAAGYIRCGNFEKYSTP